MIPRLNMSVRVGLIMMIALFAGWMTLLTAFYVSANGGRQAALPSPERLAALVEFAERTPPEDRPALMAALAGGDIAARIAKGVPNPGATEHLNVVDAATFAAITQGLAPRPVAIQPLEIPEAPRGPWVSAINAVEFRIGLAHGEMLVVSTRSPVIVAPIGLPIGFGAALIGVLISLVTLIVLHREFRPLSRLAEAVDAVDPMGEPTELPPIRARSPELRALNGAFSGAAGSVARADQGADGADRRPAT